LVYICIRYWLKLFEIDKKNLLGGVVDSRQSALWGGRYLLHSAIVANEVVEEEAKRKKMLSL